MESKNVILFVWDEEKHFNNNINNLGKNSFKEIIRIDSKDSFEHKLEMLDNNCFVHLVVHIFYSDNIRGIQNFISSGIKEKYPKIETKFISDGTLNNVKADVLTKEFSNDEENYITNNLQKYHKVRSSIDNDEVNVFMKKDLIQNQLLQFDEIAPELITVENSTSNLKLGIFLSHSSKDSEAVLKFRDIILIQGLKYDSDLIKFTSCESTGVPGGLDIPNDLYDFLLEKTGLFIQFISDNYKNSRICLNEEGAAWILLKDLMFVPIMLPGFTHNDLSWIKSHAKGININNKSSLLNLYENRKDFFSSSVNITVLNEKIDEFISSI